MEVKKRLLRFSERWKDFRNKYKIVLLAVFAGLLLLLLPERNSGAAEPRQATETAFSVSEAERGMEEILSRVEGAGQVHVMAALRTGTRRVLAEEIRQQSDSGGGTEYSSEPVVLSRGSGQQETVTLQEICPEYEGVLIVCEGGDDPAVKLKLIGAVSALTGLGADRISVCRGK